MFSTKPKLPTLRELMPELDDAVSLRERIHVEWLSMKLKATELRASIARGMTTAGQDSRVAAILAGTTPDKSEGDMKHLGELLRRIEDLGAAIEKQAGEIKLVERRASAKLCDLVRDRHNKLAALICDKLLEAHELNGQLQELVNDVQAQGASTISLPALWVQRVLGYPRDRESALGNMLRDSKQKGFLKTVPEALR